MRVICERCGSDIDIPNKKFQKRKTSNKTHKLVICKSCGTKNFVSIFARIPNLPL